MISKGPIGDAVHVRFQDCANWLTPQGVYKKRKQLERLGLPDFKGRRFITLSLDRAMFGDCPLSAYLVGKDRVRRFLEAGRVAGLWDRGAWWCWKMEFQKDGWAHWHLIIDRTRKFSVEEMRTIDKIWSLGRTNCRRISKSRFGYQFKYAFKGVYQEDGDGLCVPQWFLDYYVPARPASFPGADDAQKAVSFSRCRFWQTSKGFYTGPKRQSRPASKPSSSILPRPVSEVLTDRNSAVLVVARTRSGKYRRSMRLRLGVSYQNFIRVHLWGAENGAGCTLSASSFVLDHHGINQTIEQTDKWKLHQLLQENRLTLRRALQLRQQRKALETF